MRGFAFLAGWTAFFFLGVIALLPAGARAQADPWVEYPAREVDRPWQPAPGGLITSLTLKSIVTDQAFDQDGSVQNTNGKYNLMTLDLSLSYGITDRWEILGGIPYITGEIGETLGGGVGDIYAGTRVGLLQTAPLSLARGLRVSLPTGEADYHYELLGQDLRLQNFRTGDPSYDYYPELEARSTFGNLALRFLATGVFTDKAEVNFNRIAGFDEKAEVDPGDGCVLNAGLYYQVSDHWVSGLFLEYTALSETRVEGEGLGDEMVRFEVQPRVLYQFSQEFEAMLGGGYVLQGQNTPAGWSGIVELKTRF